MLPPQPTPGPPPSRLLKWPSLCRPIWVTLPGELIQPRCSLLVFLCVSSLLSSVVGQPRTHSSLCWLRSTLGFFAAAMTADTRGGILGSSVRQVAFQECCHHGVSLDPCSTRPPLPSLHCQSCWPLAETKDAVMADHPVVTHFLNKQSIMNVEPQLLYTVA